MYIYCKNDTRTFQCQIPCYLIWFEIFLRLLRPAKNLRQSGSLCPVDCLWVTSPCDAVSHIRLTKHRKINHETYRRCCVVNSAVRSGIDTRSVFVDRVGVPEEAGLRKCVLFITVSHCTWRCVTPAVKYRHHVIPLLHVLTLPDTWVWRLRECRLDVISVVRMMAGVGCHGRSVSQARWRTSDNTEGVRFVCRPGTVF